MLGKLDLAGFTPRQEIRAGATPFTTMAYIPFCWRFYI